MATSDKHHDIIRTLFWTFKYFMKLIKSTIEFSPLSLKDIVPNVAVSHHEEAVEGGLVEEQLRWRE